MPWKRTKFLLLAAVISAAATLAAAAAVPAAATAHQSVSHGLHIPGGTGRITHKNEIWHPTKIAGIQMAGPNGTRVSATRFAARSASASCPPNLCYNGGIVQAHPHVYLVFWGTWWQCAGACANCPGSSCGNADSAQVESYLYDYWHQVGQPGDNWATITSQYYDHRGRHPAFGHGVWGTGCSADGNNNCGWVAWQQDPPTSPTADDLAGMAVTGASYFGVANDPNAQIVVLAPQGVTPGSSDGTTFPTGGWCAYHAYAPAAGNLSLTVMPWLPDAANTLGLNNQCDANFNLLGADLNGWSKVGGHEFAESATDPVPPTGFINPSDTNNTEIGDKCNDKTFTETMPNGHKFRQQELWSNLDSNCVKELPVGAVKGYKSLCLDNAGARAVDGNKVDIWGCNGTSAQLWYYTPSSGHLIVNGGCLDVPAFSKTPGTKLIRYHCTSGSNQHWRYDASTQQFKVYGGLLGLGAMCLDDPHNSTSHGTQVIIWGCNGGANQKWSLPRG
jgi:serine protease